MNISEIRTKMSTNINNIKAGDTLSFNLYNQDVKMTILKIDRKNFMSDYTGGISRKMSIYSLNYYYLGILKATIN